MNFGRVLYSVSLLREVRVLIVLVVASVHDEDAHCLMVVKVTAVETWSGLT